MNRWAAGIRELGRSLFVLTTGERQALCLVLALALLGLGVKVWHDLNGAPDAASSVPSQRAAP